MTNGGTSTIGGLIKDLDALWTISLAGVGMDRIAGGKTTSVRNIWRRHRRDDWPTAPSRALRHHTIAATDAVRSVIASRWLDLLFALLVLAAYMTVLSVVWKVALISELPNGIVDTLPVVIFGAIARRLIIGRLVGRSVPVQIIGHAVLCVGFSLAVYWLTLVFQGVLVSPSPLTFFVRNFEPRAMAWQTFENVTLYAVVAAISYAQAPQLRAPSTQEPAPSGASPEKKDSSRYLVRSGDELRPIDLDRIVSIAGADDYAELSTLDGKRLVAMTLAEFEASLDPARFVRIHRSRIVNLDFVDSAEPDGAGRLLLHLRTGETVSTSRTGARLLKTRVI